MDIGFEFLRHETPEQSNQQICLLVNGSVHHNIILIVNSHVGVAGTYYARYYNTPIIIIFMTKLYIVVILQPDWSLGGGISAHIARG